MNVKKLYHNYIFALAISRNAHNFYKSFDRRRNEDKQALAAFEAYRKKQNEWADVASYLEKRKKRLSNRFVFTPIAQNGMWLDYKRNKPLKVYADHLNFGQRNHWASTPTDYNVLRVAMKYNK